MWEICSCLENDDMLLLLTDWEPFAVTKEWQSWGSYPSLNRIWFRRERELNEEIVE